MEQYRKTAHVCSLILMIGGIIDTALMLIITIFASSFATGTISNYLSQFDRFISPGIFSAASMFITVLLVIATIITFVFFVLFPMLSFLKTRMNKTSFGAAMAFGIVSSVINALSIIFTANIFSSSSNPAPYAVIPAIALMLSLATAVFSGLGKKALVNP